MNSKIVTVTVFFNFLTKVCSKLSPEDIRDVTESIKVDRRDLLNSSIINPVFGYLFESTGALNNIRFYGPGMKIQKTNSVRNFGLDSSSDDIVRLAIELFPSPTGILCHIRNKKDNFGYVFKNNIDEGIQFMSDIFINVLQNKEFESERFRTVSDIILNSENTVFNSTDSKIIKLSMIHSFMINALDSKDHLKRYLNTILESEYIFDNLNSFVLNNVNVIDEVLKIRKKYLGFPYSELNQPPSNSVIPIYDRKNNSFSDKKFFSDCADIVLLNICNCLLYDSDRLCYSLDKLEKDSDIYRFYKEHDKLFTVTDTIRNKWSKVIQGLDDFKDGNFNKIVYLKEKRNEVDTGIINMMNVLIKIFKIDHEEFWRDFNNTKIIDKLNSLFKMISSNGKIIKVESKLLEEVDLGKRIEIFGSFNVLFDLRETRIKIQVRQTNLHADIGVIEYTNKLNETFKSRRNDNTDNLLDILYMNFCENIGIQDTIKRIYFSSVIQTNEQKREVIMNILDSIVKQENSNKNELHKRIIDLILETVNLNDRGTFQFFKLCLVYFDNLSNTDIIDNWISSLHNETKEVYKLWEQRVVETKVENASLFLSLLPRNRIQKVFEMLNRMESLKSLSLENIPDYFYTEECSLDLPIGLKDLKIAVFSKMYNTRVLVDTLQRLNNLQSVDISFFSISDASLLFRSLKNLRKIRIHKQCYSEEEIDSLIKTLENLSSNLQSLGISGVIANKEKFQELTTVISTMTQLTELSINEQNLNEDDVKSFMAAISHLNNLKVLDISRTRIPSNQVNEFASTLGKLNNLEELDISKCSLSKDELNTITKEIKKLASLNISNNRLSLEDTAGVLRELKNLRSLNISHLNIKTSDLEEFSQALGNMTELKELNISKCKMNNKNSKFILQAIKRLENLESLNISQYSLNKIKSQYLIQTIQKLKKLKNSNLEGWEYNSIDIEKLLL